MLMMSVVNMFMRSAILYDINLYLGLIIMCGFILYDTQLIVEKRRRGDDDYIWWVGHTWRDDLVRDRPLDGEGEMTLLGTDQ